MTIKHFIIIIVMALPITTTTWAGDTKPTAQPTLTNEELKSYLFEAAKSGSPEEIEALLAKGADLNATDNGGNTPLHLAASSNSNSGVTKALLEAEADHNTINYFGETPLHLAAMYNSNPEVTKALLEAGADSNAKDNYDKTSLHSAARNNSPGVTKALLEAGADPNAKDKFGETPLYRVAEYRIDSPEKTEIIEMLKKAMADMEE